MFTTKQIQEFVDIFRPTIEELCWEWEGHLTKDGYPILSEENERKKAHRIAFFLAFPGLKYRMRTRQIHHKCYNRLCVNAGHMQLVTQREHQAITTRDHFAKIDAMRKERGFD